MCGITGYISIDSIPSEGTLRKMTARLQHRGPDADGYFHDGQCALGHRRLSILDLSDRANQPMTSMNQRYVMVYNGEVYNIQ